MENKNSNQDMEERIVEITKLKDGKFDRFRVEGELGYRLTRNYKHNIEESQGRVMDLPFTIKCFHTQKICDGHYPLFETKESWRDDGALEKRSGSEETLEEADSELYSRVLWEAKMKNEFDNARIIDLTTTENCFGIKRPRAKQGRPKKLKKIREFDCERRLDSWYLNRLKPEWKKDFKKYDGDIYSNLDLLKDPEKYKEFLLERMLSPMEARTVREGSPVTDNFGDNDGDTCTFAKLEYKERRAYGNPAYQGLIRAGNVKAVCGFCLENYDLNEKERKILLDNIQESKKYGNLEGFKLG